MGKINKSRVLTLAKGFRLLEFIIERESVALNDAAEFLSIYKSSCYKYLYTLCVLGYIEKGRNKSYTLTDRVSRLVHGKIPDIEINRIAEPFLGELLNYSQQNVKLGFWTENQIEYVHQMSVGEYPDPRSAVNTYVPAYSTALGKAILAFLPESEQHAFLSEIQLKAHTPKTIITPDELNRQLSRVQRLGFACSDGELISEQNAIAAPVFDKYGYPRYALGISAPSHKLTQERLLEMVPTLLGVADDLTQKLSGENKGKANKSLMQTVEKGIRLLEFIIRNKRVTLTEAAAFLSIHKSACYKFLFTLSSLDYIEKGADKTYQLTGRFEKLSLGKIPRIEVKNEATPYLEELSGFSNETTNLGYWTGSKVEYLDQTSTAKSPAPELAINTYIPPHCTSMGKAILAFLPRSEQQSFISGAQLEEHTPKTITTSEQLGHELSKIKQCGYAFMDEEFMIGLIGIAAPVFDVNGYPQYAVSIAAPTYRLSKEEILQMAPKLLKIAKELTHRIKEKNIGLDV